MGLQSVDDKVIEAKRNVRQYIPFLCTKETIHGSFVTNMEKTIIITEKLLKSYIICFP